MAVFEGALVRLLLEKLEGGREKEESVRENEHTNREMPFN